MKKRIIAFVVAVVLVLGLGGCGVSDKQFAQEGIDLVLILGNHANANRYSEQIVTDRIHDLLMDAVTYYKDGSDYVARLNVTVIISDGDPVQEVLMEEYENRDGEIVVQPLELTDDATYAEKAMREAEDIVERVEEALLDDNLRAKDTEVDLLAAISEAARILHSSTGTQKHIFIYDTGIVTTGKMAMGVGEGKIDIQQGTVDEVLDDIGASAFPKLNGIHVHFYGLGDVCVGQKDMRKYADESFQNRFVELWTKFFERCGVEKKNLNEGNPLTYSATSAEGSAMLWEGDDEGLTDPSELYPEVSNVPFYEIVEDTGDGEDGETGATEPPEPTPINLSASELGGFYGDAEGQDPSKFKNPEKAIAALRSYEEYALREVREHPELKLYVIGSCAMTAPNQDDKDNRVSEVRAIAVSKLLQEEFGIPAEQIVEIDAGVQRFSWSSTKKEFVNGKGPDQEAQAEHRVVTLIPSTENNMDRIAELGNEPDVCP